MATRKPLYIAVSGKQRLNVDVDLRRRRRQKAERKLAQRSVGHDDQALGWSPRAFDRLEQRSVEFVSERQVERSLLPERSLSWPGIIMASSASSAARKLGRRLGLPEGLPLRPGRKRVCSGGLLCVASLATIRALESASAFCTEWPRMAAQLRFACSLR